MARSRRDELIEEAARCLEDRDRAGWRRAHRELSRSLTPNRLNRLVGQARKRLRESAQLQVA